MFFNLKIMENWPNFCDSLVALCTSRTTMNHIFNQMLVDNPKDLESIVEVED